VTRLLLAGAAPEAILCVTYTKAGAAEMQRRLFDQLGGWAVLPDPELAGKLAKIGEAGRDLGKARALFAQALETPGGLKIQTIHAFCEKLLRRFPLEAGVLPGFVVMDDAEAARVSRLTRDEVAEAAMKFSDHDVGLAYRHLAVELDFASFEKLFATFEARRAAIAAYAGACEAAGSNYRADVWRRCGFNGPGTLAEVEAAALARVRWTGWRRAVESLAASKMVTDQKLAAAMGALAPGARFAEVWAVFATKAGEPRAKLATKSVDAGTAAWLIEEQARHLESRQRLADATMAENTVHVLSLGIAYATLFAAAKARRGALDFDDLIDGALDLVTNRADAAWVLFKLDNGLEHVLLDEAQDTAPAQWDVLRALTDEFFHGAGAGAPGRTVFAVGDAKQSIFSFQGARPERLAVETQAFERRVRSAAERFEQVSLPESWRSRPEILRLVDAVFADDAARAGISPAGVTALPLEHVATREAGGCVDLWEVQEAAPGPEIDPWAPVDEELGISANKLLAGAIAAAIKAMVDGQERVSDAETGADRPCRYGDILILVRRRKALFDEIIRALKREGVPLAGADRLKLSVHGLYADLMALGQFARFPSDDLTLAALLRGPFCDVSETSLFDLAHDRRGSLWAALMARVAERAEWRSAAEFLAWAVEAARADNAFNFYGAALSRLDGAGRSMRQRILTRLGGEAEEALDAFIAQTLTAEAEGARDLEAFLAWMAASDIEIKRQSADGGGEVRVMTVHGAKGLEAPIVIVPDTTSRVTSQGGPLLDDEDGGLLWAPRGPDDCAASAKARLARDQAAADESMRLLYVALTRARDHLIVAGVKSRSHERSWYDYVRRGFDRLETRPIAKSERYGVDPVVLAETAVEAATTSASLPAWSQTLAAREPAAARLVSPSRLGEESDGAAPSPLARAGGLGRYRRGEIIHRLLQLLPDIAPEDRAAAAARRLAAELDLSDEQRGEIAGAALGVLEDAAFAAVFAPGSRAEVAIAGGAASLPDEVKVSGRVDRLVVGPERVLVVDFKTNRPAPARVEHADPGYIRQMAVYAAVLGEIFPGHAIEAALVWTDGPRLMAVPRSMIDAELAALREAAQSR
jgi:ATP-dependent helicase/nuclease subunit A